MHSIADIPTPSFVIDRAIMDENCRRMRQKAFSSGVAFRPHVKTHKTREGARMQHAGEIGPVTVSTLAEAEFLAADGFDDITYAVPIVASKLERAARLARSIRRLSVLIDSDLALREIEKFATQHATVFDVILKVDCGYHRAGVDPASPDSIRLVEAMVSSPAVRFHGYLTHAGHSYNARSREEILRIAAEESSALTRFRAGFDESIAREATRSIGSTPTNSLVERFDDCDEIRPGNYVFYDAFQATIGSCDLADVAVSVVTSVIGSYPERGSLLIDAGALALSKDDGPDHLQPDCGFGLVCDESLHPLPLRIRALSQEHGKVYGEAAEIARHVVGSRLRVVPNHSCLTAAMFDRYYVVDDGKVVEEWQPVRGW